MSTLEFVLLIGAGIVGGLTGSIAGLASLVTYPALLAVGLPPVSANVTNTVALVLAGVGSALGSRPELKGQGARIRSLAPIAALGGVIGAVLLLSTPADGFQKVVPWLLGLSSLTILIPRRPPPLESAAPMVPTVRARVLEGLAILLIAVYGGYFGAAAGVLLLALLLRTTHAALARANATKNVLLGVANTIAAVLFVILAPVSWAAAIPLGIGCLIGSRLGPIVVRRAPATLLRYLIGAAGIALAIRLGIQAYA